jgi:chromosome segregation protein
MPRPERAGVAHGRAAHVEASWRIRQAHYAAGDELHRPRVACRGALEVSRLEERIRFVVEGRQRAQQRLAELQAQTSSGASARAAAEELEQVAEQIAAADEQARSWPPRPKSRPASCRERGRCAPPRPAPTSSGLVAQVQQQIQVLAAESRSIDEQARCASAKTAWRPRAARWRARPRSAERPARSSAAADEARPSPRACTSWPSSCRSWTSSAAPQQDATRSWRGRPS